MVICIVCVWWKFVWTGISVFATARDRCHRAASASTQTTDYHCDACGRLCASSFGLRGHVRSHRWEHRLCHCQTLMDYQHSLCIEDLLNDTHGCFPFVLVPSVGVDKLWGEDFVVQLTRGFLHLSFLVQKVLTTSIVSWLLAEIHLVFNKNHIFAHHPSFFFTKKNDGCLSFLGVNFSMLEWFAVTVVIIWLTFPLFRTNRKTFTWGFLFCIFKAN